MGIGPVNLQVGNLIYLPYGARTPFIVRNRNIKDTHQLVGGAYVHGLMFGEALQRAFLKS